MRDAFGARLMADLEAMSTARCPDAAASARVSARRASLQRRALELAQALLLGPVASPAPMHEALVGLDGAQRELAQRWARDAQRYASIADALGQVYLRLADLVMMCHEVEHPTPSALARRELWRGLSQLSACLARWASARPTRGTRVLAQWATTWLGLAMTPEAQLQAHASALLPALLRDLELLLHGQTLIQGVRDALQRTLGE